MLHQLSAKILGRDEAIEMFDLRSARSFHIWQLEQDECYDVSDSLSKTTFYIYANLDLIVTSSTS